MIVSSSLRSVGHLRSYKSLLAVVGLALLLLAKKKRILPASFSTRDFSRAYSLNTITSHGTVEDIVERVMQCPYSGL